jgi:S1-C subfamily serine protease
MTRLAAEPAADRRRRSRRRLAGACLLAATALTVALPTQALASTTEDTARSPILTISRGDGGGDAGWGDSSWGEPPDQQTATVNSGPATDDESTGVVLIDTVLNGGQGAGTGMVLTSSGEVLTNYHVVEGATEITVTVATTGNTYDATVVGSDETADVALLQLQDATGLDPISVDDDAVSVGDDVTAVGNAGGTGTLSAAGGTVTSLRSTITTSSEGSVEGETLTSLIETDADVVPGDSGGPLIDDDGEVVGIDTAASTGTEIDGYAIPIENALEVVAQIRSGEETDTVRIGSSGYLGVELAGGSAQYQDVTGAEIAGVVAGGAAAAAGIAAGDVVTRIDTTMIGSAGELATAIGDHAAGDRVTISWTDTRGENHTATVTLGPSPTA